MVQEWIKFLQKQNKKISEEIKIIILQILSQELENLDIKPLE
jgi:hypothetical protein